MELVAGLLIGMFGLMVGEVVILIWFIIRAVGLTQGKTNFRIHWAIPILYIVYMLPIALFVFNLEYGLWAEGDYVPVATRLSNASRIFIVVNLSTPLFPILAWLKNNTIKKLKVTHPSET